MQAKTAGRIRWFVVVLGLLTGSTLGSDAVEPRLVRGTISHPCRLYIEDSTGAFHFARSADPARPAVVYDVQRSNPSVERHTTLTAREFVAELPPGTYKLTAERGKEFTPSEIRVTIPETGDLPHVALELNRWVDMPAAHWYSGDTHVHRQLEELPNLIEAEDLHVVLPLTYWVRAAYESPANMPVGGHPEPRPIVVRSSEPPRAQPIERVIWPINTEYELFTVNGQAHTQGAVFVLNHNRPLDVAAPPVAQVAVAARQQNALLDLDKHSWNWSMMIIPLMNVDLYELANNHVWRTGFLFKNWTVEALPKDWDIETDGDGYTERGWIDWGFKNYYALLNCGFRLRPTGGTASGVHPVPLGFGRVYVECPEGFSYEHWIRGLDAGRSFVTTGPMLTVRFDDQPPGTVFPSARPHAVRVHGIAQSLKPLDRIEIIVNGTVAQSIRPENSRQSNGLGLATRFDVEVPLSNSAWIAVRCFEPRADERQPAKFYYAHTAPVHFEIDGPIRPQAREVNYLIQRMEDEIARNRNVLTPEALKEYEQARDIYRAIADRPASGGR